MSELMEILVRDGLEYGVIRCCKSIKLSFDDTEVTITKGHNKEIEINTESRMSIRPNVSNSITIKIDS